MRGWNSQTIDWYLRAGECSQYPGEVLKKIAPRLCPRHTVLDIGCGPGLYALAVAPLVKQVLAMDRLDIVLRTLNSLARERGLNNIHCLESTWPDTEIRDKVDIVISAFSSAQVMNSKASIAKILSLKAETVFLVAPGQYRPPFNWPQHVGAHPDSDFTLALLRSMGIGFSCQTMAIDFGQPVRDLQEAEKFLSQYLRIPPSAACRHAKEIGQPHPQGIYLPNLRNVVLITISRVYSMPC